MKSLMIFGAFFFALAFCGVTDKIKELTTGAGDSQPLKTDSENSEKQSARTDSDEDAAFEKPKLSAGQEEILSAGKKIDWTEQGMNFTVPEGWNEMSVKKEMLNYGSPKTGFLIGTIAVMPDDFPSETSLEAQHTQALQQLKNGKYEAVRRLEIDGVKGVEWIEAPSEEAGDPRRHQWIGFRNYQGQNQQINVMVTTKSGEFDDKKDTFAAILYSMNFD